MPESLTDRLHTSMHEVSDYARLSVLECLVIIRKLERDGLIRVQKHRSKSLFKYPYLTTVEILDPRIKNMGIKDSKGLAHLILVAKAEQADLP